MHLTIIWYRFGTFRSFKMVTKDPTKLYNLNELMALVQAMQVKFYHFEQYRALKTAELWILAIWMCNNSNNTFYLPLRQECQEIQLSQWNPAFLFIFTYIFVYFSINQLIKLPSFLEVLGGRCLPNWNIIRLLILVLVHIFTYFYIHVQSASLLVPWVQRGLGVRNPEVLDHP